MDAYRIASISVELIVLGATVYAMLLALRLALVDIGLDPKYHAFIRSVLNTFWFVIIVFLTAHLMLFYPREWITGYGAQAGGSFDPRFWKGQQLLLEKVFLPVLISFCFLFVIMAILLILSLERQHLLLWRSGKDENVALRWKNALTLVLGHGRILRELYPGSMHLLIFWGVIFIFTGKLIRVFAYPLGLTTPPQSIFLKASFISEVGGAMVIGGGLLGFVRRYLIKPSRLDTKLENHLIYILGFIVIVTGYVIKAYRIKAVFYLYPPDGLSWAPLSGLMMPAIAIFQLERLNEIMVWHRTLMHAVPASGLLLYLIISRTPLKHMFLSFLGLLYRPLKPRVVLSSIPAFEEAETYGANRIFDFTWRQLLDLEACTRCGRCQDNCPAYLTDKPLSPKKLLQDLKSVLCERGKSLVWSRSSRLNDDHGLIGTVISEEMVWACTFCLNCYEQCPILIPAFDKIIEMRRHLVLMESRFPSELREVFRNMERRRNPWGIERNLRSDWAKELGIKTIAEDPDVDLLYFPGCFKGYDDRNKKVARSVASILKSSGIKFAIAGEQEGCCGDPARRAGNEYLFRMLAEANIEMFNRYGVKRILTTCPHCYSVLKREYPELGGDFFEVIHHTEFLDGLLRQGRLELKGKGKLVVTYHDSCYLGRYHSVYDEPRRIIRTVRGVVLEEMELSRHRSFCCGGGGGRMWMEEHSGRRINEERIEQALRVTPEIIITACPYCLSMLWDGLKSKGVEDSAKIMDIAEYVEMFMG